MLSSLRLFNFRTATNGRNNNLLSHFRDDNLGLLSRRLCRFSSEAGHEKTKVPVEFLYLNNLRDNPGAVKKYRRVGRGIGSSKGKTCGRGHKGLKQRSGGKVPLWFEGGQVPLVKRLPKRGFKSQGRDLAAVNVGRLQDLVDMGRLPKVGKSSEVNPITMRDLVKAEVIRSNTTFKRGGIKLLADGKDRLTSPMHLLVSRASQEAIKAVERVGGTVTTFHYSDRALRQHLRGKVKDRRARPPPKEQPYYTSLYRRGFLHPSMQMRKWFQKSGADFKTKFDELIKEKEEIRAKASDADSGSTAS